MLRLPRQTKQGPKVINRRRTSVDLYEVLQVLQLPRKTNLKLIQVLHLPRKTSLKLLQVLRLPRKTSLKLLHILRLPRKSRRRPK